MSARHLFIFMFTLLLASCTKHSDRAVVDVRIGHEINGKSLVTDTLCYENEAGNTFMVTEIQWFLSDIALLDEQGEWRSLRQRDALDSIAQLTENIFYIDTDIAESQTLHAKKIPVGHYTALRFTFGLDEHDNESGHFTDPPEAEMFWPDALGGGYHYMKLNGKFVDDAGRLAPLAIHLGIGQNGDCTEFYQNYFIVELPVDFTVAQNAENQLDLTMVVDNWFRNPNLIDFNEYGSSIMQNQTAQHLLNGNGMDVFKIGQPIENQNNMAMIEGETLGEKFRNAMHKATPEPHFWRWQNVKARWERIAEELKSAS